MDYLDPH
jgi:hypothetical protein